MTPDRKTNVESIDRPPKHSDEALALAFAERHEKDLRYVAAWNRWFQWVGTHWRPDDTLFAFAQARQVCRTAARNAKEREAQKLASAPTVAAVERLAKADHRLAARVKDFDTDPWLLATPDGTVDLRTGKLRAANRADMITKCTAVAPSEKPDCPIFLASLDRTFDKNGDIISYIQRLAGYALTGSTREHAMAFGHGDGGNGKSTLINTISGIMGDYATVAPMETFTASKTDRHPTELAMLRGARLVTATETQQGREWDEAKIKALTGGDPITARFMRGDFFTYAPQFKLIVSGNHKPALRNIDEAIRRRFHLIPFVTTIPADERDPDLPEKLKTEWPGVLRWMIDGCLAWRANGLKPPDAVRKATDEYLAEEDAIGTWLAERTEKDSKAFELTENLFADWTGWAERTGERVGTMKRFSTNLAKPERDLNKHRDSATGKMGFYGVRLLGTPLPS